MRFLLLFSFFFFNELAATFQNVNKLHHFSTKNTPILQCKAGENQHKTQISLSHSIKYSKHKQPVPVNRNRNASYTAQWSVRTELHKLPLLSSLPLTSHLIFLKIIFSELILRWCSTSFLCCHMAILQKVDLRLLPFH
jgi:hypothetical protein